MLLKSVRKNKCLFFYSFIRLAEFSDIFFVDFVNSVIIKRKHSYKIVKLNFGYF